MNIHYHPIMSDEELAAAQRAGFSATKFVRDLPEGLVIPRYTLQAPVRSVYLEEVNRNGLYSLNTPSQSRFLSSLFEWYPYLEDLTPKTYFSHEFNRVLKGQGAWVVKGLEKSRKDNWSRMMYADSPRRAVELVSELYQDSGTNWQDVCIREYVPLTTYAEGINGIPVTNEWRVFVLDGKLQYSCYYWTNYLDIVPEPQEKHRFAAQSLALSVAEKLSHRGCLPRWFVVDCAETQTGRWIVVELNDAQQSGVPVMDDEDYFTFYRRLRKGLLRESAL